MINLINLNCCYYFSVKIIDQYIFLLLYNNIILLYIKIYTVKQKIKPYQSNIENGNIGKCYQNQKKVGAR